MNRCVDCGTFEAIARMMPAEITCVRGAVVFVDDTMIPGQVKCADDHDCFRRKRMNMGPVPVAYRYGKPIE